jgi:imidazolonepropionase-like amidohydrolase
VGLRDRGTLTAGRRADLLVVRGNPLQDLTCLRDVEGVMKAGRWVFRREGRPAQTTATGL